MDRADKLGAEHVSQIGRYRGKAATVHGQDDAEERHEQRQATALCRRRNGRIQRKTEQEERVIGHLAADFVRERGPHKTSADVEQRQQPGEACGNGGNGRFLLGCQVIERNIDTDQFAAEDFLQHR